MSNDMDALKLEELNKKYIGKTVEILYGSNSEVGEIVCVSGGVEENPRFYIRSEFSRGVYKYLDEIKIL